MELLCYLSTSTLSLIMVYNRLPNKVYILDFLSINLYLPCPLIGKEVQDRQISAASTSPYTQTIRTCLSATTAELLQWSCQALRSIPHSQIHKKSNRINLRRQSSHRPSAWTLSLKSIYTRPTKQGSLCRSKRRRIEFKSRWPSIAGGNLDLGGPSM